MGEHGRPEPTRALRAQPVLLATTLVLLYSGLARAQDARGGGGETRADESSGHYDIAEHDAAVDVGFFVPSGRLLREGALVVRHGGPSTAFGAAYAPTDFLQVGATGDLPIGVNARGGGSADIALGGALDWGPGGAFGSVFFGLWHGNSLDGTEPETGGGGGAAVHLCFDRTCRWSTSLAASLVRAYGTSAVQAGGILHWRFPDGSPLSLFIEPRLYSVLGGERERGVTALLGLRFSDRAGAADIVLGRVSHDFNSASVWLRLTLALL